MKFAHTVQDMINSFDPRELCGSELDEYYYDKTMEARTGDAEDSPILNLYDDCRTSCENSAYLLLGHRGCGKSTELNKMAENLEKEGYPVRTVRCASEMNMSNPLCADLLMLIGNTVLNVASETKCRIQRDVLETIERFWDERDYETVRKKENTAEIGADASIESPGLLEKLLKFGVSLAVGIKYGEQRIEKNREKVLQHIGELTDAVNRVANAIEEKLGGKQVIIIFEDLDKLQGDTADKIFFDIQTPNLVRFHFPVIYTFPIALRYDTKYRTLDSYFRQKYFFPIIKLETLDGMEETGGIRRYRTKKYAKGYETIKAIVEKRSDLALFAGQEYFSDDGKCEQSVLYRMIQKTGGSLRDLFSVIRMAAQISRRRGHTAIDMADAERGIQKLATELNRMIEVKDYPFLVDICKGNVKTIEEKDILLDMMQGGIVMEYNGEGWHNVHPLVRDFLESQGYLDIAL